jgi:mannose-1-phosphate guanylyltransferase
MPTDHAVADEAVFGSAVEHALEAVRSHEDAIALLAAEPSDSDADYGWIVPAMGAPPGDDGVASVARADRWPSVAAFREKPAGDELPRLRAAGALLNTFVFAAKAATLERAFQRWAPQYFEGMVATLSDPALLEVTFDLLPNSNFSRDVLERMAGQLRIVPLPKSAGWSDIGTPERLARARWVPEHGVRAIDGPRVHPTARA